MPSNPTALIAEDEPLLAAALCAELAQVWPALRVVSCVGNGASAVAQALLHQPDVLFLDIRMPGLSGLDAAAELIDAWPAVGPGRKPFPALVFVTAYDQYAVQAFEAQALDYLLKPVQTARLKKTVSKVQLVLSARAQAAIQEVANSAPGASQTDLTLETTLAQLRQLLATANSAPDAATLPGGAGTAALPLLAHIQASVGSAIHLVSVSEVVYFEAADKYVRVLTQAREYLIRTPLKDLLPQLPGSFWQVHRGTVVQADRIEAVSRDEGGKLWLQLRGRPERLAVSRLYAHLFKAM
jgi:DNA-binding LytR/AlgR family response regulator